MMAYIHREQAAFGRRKSPPRLIFARGDEIRSLTVRSWMVGLVAGVSLGLLTWLVGTTAFFFYHDDLDRLARSYQIEVQRSYEDRIASLRGQIEEITTQRYLDQQAVEERMRGIAAVQEELTARQVRVAALIDDAEKRGIALVPQDDSPYVTGSLAPSRPTPLAPKFASLRGASKGVKISLVDDNIGLVERGLSDINQTQKFALAAVEKGLRARFTKLAKIPETLGLKVARPTNAETGVGGPFIPAAGILAVPSSVDATIDRLEHSFSALKSLEKQVRRLPVRRPVNAQVSSSFGTRNDPFLNRPAMHSGIDFRAKSGTRIRAAAAGKVITAGRNGGYGNMVEIDHGNGLTTRYAHMSRISVQKGQRVAPDEIIGRVGSTGRSTGPHLHYETRVDGKAVNPSRYLMAGRHLEK